MCRLLWVKAVQLILVEASLCVGVGSVNLLRAFLFSCVLFDCLNESKNSSCCHVSVAGVMVSIVAFQAMDPGSIPGRRILIADCFVCVKNPHLARNPNVSSENL